MKRYIVSVTLPALRDIRQWHQWVHEQQKWAPEQIEEWYAGIWKTIYSLDMMPERCAVVPESERFTTPIRQKLYRSLRILFAVKQATVYVLAVRHTSQNTLSVD